MFIDTHCHLNMMIKKTFDTPMTPDEFNQATVIVDQAYQQGVERIINVGTSVVESINCTELAARNKNVYAAIGIHPNDCTKNWRKDIDELKLLLKKDHLKKIVAIGECGMDFHYPDYDIQRQRDAFTIQIDLALEHNLALIVHTRDAGDETLRALDNYRKEQVRGVIHCFSETAAFADTAIGLGFVLGIGAPIGYPKNNTLREIFKKIDLKNIILETDAPFLPPQALRGKQNSPIYIPRIAAELANVRDQALEEIEHATTANALRAFFNE
jgi:TatD DNase family protein